MTIYIIILLCNKAVDNIFLVPRSRMKYIKSRNIRPLHRSFTKYFISTFNLVYFVAFEIGMKHAHESLLDLATVEFQQSCVCC